MFCITQADSWIESPQDSGPKDITKALRPSLPSLTQRARLNRSKLCQGQDFFQSPHTHFTSVLIFSQLNLKGWGSSSASNDPSNNNLRAERCRKASGILIGSALHEGSDCYIGWTSVHPSVQPSCAQYSWPLKHFPKAWGQYRCSLPQGFNKDSRMRAKLRKSSNIS